MLCLSSFELYSRWVPLEKANRVFRLATKWAFFRPLGMIHFFPTWENIFFFIIYYLLTMVDVRVKTAWYWTRAFQLFSAYGVDFVSVNTSAMIIITGLFLSLDIWLRFRATTSNHIINSKIPLCAETIFWSLFWNRVRFQQRNEPFSFEWTWLHNLPMSLIWWVMVCLWEFGVLQHWNEINFGDTSFRHFTAYLGRSSGKVIKPVKSFAIWFCGHEGVQSSIAFLYFNLTDQNSSQNSLLRHNFSKPSASSQHKLQHRCFHLWYLPLFTTSLFCLLSGLHTCSHAV